jgi:WD40 repeat protein
VAYSPDGRTVLTGSQDKTARFWDAATCRPIGKPLFHSYEVRAVAFSPDGKIVLTGGPRAAQLWEVATGRPLGPPILYQIHPLSDGANSELVFSPDGKTFLIWKVGDIPRLWRVPSPVAGEVERIVLWVQVITGMELDDADVVTPLNVPTWEERRRRLENLGGPPLR